MICRCRGSSRSKNATGQVSSASGSSVWFVYENTAPRDVPRLLPLELVLVDQQPQQLGDRERRVRVVELDRDRVGQRLERAPSRRCCARMSCRLALTKKYCCRSRSSLPCGVVSSGYRIRDTFLASDLRGGGLGVAPGVERLDVEWRDRAARPQPQVIDRLAAVARGSGWSYPTAQMSCVSTQRCVHLALRVLRGDAAAAEADDVAGVVARDFPRVAGAAASCSRSRAARSVLVDRLREDAVVVADAVGDRRKLQRRERIEVTGGETAETAVAKPGIDFFLGDAVEVEAHALRARARLGDEVTVEACEPVDQRAAEQIFDRQIADPLDRRLRRCGAESRASARRSSSRIASDSAL